MYRIGVFAIISRVSVKMLRHYDKIGLFCPAVVDPFTGYRYYTLDQLPRLNRLMALKDMGFSLSQVAELLDKPLPTDELLTLLSARIEAMKDEAAALQRRLNALTSWKKRIEMEDKMPDGEITLKPITEPIVPPTPPTDRDKMFTIPLPNRAGFDHDIFIEIGAEPPADALASVVHTGSVETLLQAYTALDKWIQANGYRIAGVPNEITLREENPDEAVIEIQLPVSTRPA